MKWAKARPIGLKPAPGFMSASLNVQGGRPMFPTERAWLQREALDSLMQANIQILDSGGRLLITDMWRTPQEQLAEWLRWASGRKTSYSPPPGAGMHEIGRAVDIDLRSESTKIPAEQICEILNNHGWVSIAPLGTPGHWHWEHRDKFLQRKKESEGYAAMVALAFERAKYQFPFQAAVKDIKKSDPSQKQWL